jgi:hypothetical protein
VKKYIKKISVLFLWVACLILFAHQLIPHDHHSDSSFSDDRVECLTHQNSHSNHHHSGFPMHCHSLNDLTFEKRISIIPFSVELQVFCFLSSEINDLRVVKETNMPFWFIHQNEFNPTSVILTSSSLRAPPSFS